MMDVSQSEPALWYVQSEIDQNATVEVKKARTNKHTQCVEWKKCNVFTFGENCNGNNRCSIDAMQLHKYTFEMAIANAIVIELLLASSFSLPLSISIIRE